MRKRWGSLLMIAGLAFLPIALQSGIASFKTFVSGIPLLQERTKSRAIDDPEFSENTGSPTTLCNIEGHLLNVCATWCPPCLKEMPSLDRLKSILERDSHITVVALSVDVAGFEQLQAFNDANNLKNLAFCRRDKQTVMSALVINGLPTTLLLDHKSQEVARLIGPTARDTPNVIASLKVIHGHA